MNINRAELLAILNKRFDNKNLVKHMLAVEAAMGGLYDFFKETRPKDVKQTREEWTVAGLLHDLDYQDDVPLEKHGLITPEILKKEKIVASSLVLRAIAAHNWKRTKIMPRTLMEWSLFGCDELTGLIVAATLVLPCRRLADLKTENVLRRFKEKSFARGVDRDDIRLGAEKMRISVDKLVAIVLSSMRGIGHELGL